MTMLITVSSSIQPIPTRHHLPPPPTLPKPGKDNLRLQRLLKKAAKKNAALGSEQAKPFRSSLSPVSEASPDLEHDEDAAQEESPEPAAPPCSRLPAALPSRALPPRVCSPVRRSKPFALKVTEQRRIAEHVMLTASSAMPLLHRPAAAEAPGQPEGTDTLLPSPHDPALPLFPPPPPAGPPGIEQAPEVACGTKRKEANLFLPRRLPILLHKPRFDARKLKELAAKPMTKISTVFEVSHFRHEGAEKHPRSFNRTASGWSVS
ncbi:proline-rich protein 33 [Indicator indicator]|uniref:proline-rich protein 33 n=1 Tax=Indicator indicator TaxID=1002788 RepID=UPI0023DFFB58|nr:proline-rich protein 33 [Indicator indicator]